VRAVDVLHAGGELEAGLAYQALLLALFTVQALLFNL
jgi:hypothetical protein